MLLIVYTYTHTHTLPTSAALLSTHPVFLELSKYNRLSVQQLIQAQEDIVRSLEKKWLKDYVAYLNSKVKEVAAKAESKRPLSKRNTVSIV